MFIEILEFLRMRGRSKETCEKVQATNVSTLYGLCEPAVFNSFTLCEVFASFLPQGIDKLFPYLLWLSFLI